MSFRFTCLLLILAITGGLPACQKSDQQSKQDSYPWQVTILADGGSRIFGIRLGVTTVSEARQLVGNSPQLALFENPDGVLSLELFYPEFTRTGLSGRLVLTIGANHPVLQGLKQRAIKKTRLPSGAVQYRLDLTALNQIGAWPVAAMTYVPYADLDENMILGRFGEPAEKIRRHGKAQHWLYPDKGLDLVVNEAGKEILEYVPPAEFEKLARPLRP